MMKWMDETELMASQAQSLVERATNFQAGSPTVVTFMI